MRQTWEKLLLRLDALNLRERVLVFGGAALVLVFLLNMLLLDPAFRRQKSVAQQMKQDQEQISKIQLEIQAKVRAQAEDPDKLNQEKLKKLQQEMDGLRTDLTNVQKNLVPPQQMTMVLQDILKRNGRLKLVSLKNLPQVNLNTLDAKKPEGTDAKSAGKPSAKNDTREFQGGAIYQHAVEIVVYGNYMDVMNYLNALESMRWQVYWSKAKFHVDTYPNGTLSLTVYTLSMDKTWLNL